MAIPHTHSDPEFASVRRRAPLNSVSTRIILCVFGSTLLTALIVSWLSIGAIHKDVQRRVTQQAQAQLSDRTGALEGWLSTSTAQLAASSAIGTEWHGQLIASLDLQRVSEGISAHWIAESADGYGDQKGLILPSPPPELSAAYDRLSLVPLVQDSASERVLPLLGCLSASVDLVLPDSSVAGRLDGCLSQDTVFTFLLPDASAMPGMRILLVDSSGRVNAGAGARASARLGQTLPLAGLLYPTSGAISSYSTAAGTRLVGAIATIGQSGWHLVAEAEHAAAFAPAIAITNQIFIVDVCIILLFSVLAYQVTVAIMKPIEALSEGAHRISQGQVDYQIPVPANDDDELGLLTRTFNDMMAKLRSNQTEIEQDRFRLGEKNEELQRANEILSQLSITDGLTKLHNHRYFQDHLTREIKRVSRTKAPLSLILIDIDDFKLLNDTHGHAAGDEVLVSLAAIMNDSARESDLIARYGGEEFVILMPNTDLPGAVHLAEKIRMAVESTRLIIGDNMKPVDITISLGVALFDGDRREFFTNADKALYEAKGAGKNCVIIAGADPAAP